MKNARVLCDTYAKSGLRLITESAELSKKKFNSNAIGCLEGPCSDYSIETRNNNYYSKKLWENVLNSEYFKEGMETKTLFGEVDHPEERLELKAENAAICMTECWFDDDNQCLMGRFDILPTEKGKIVKALCDYGSHLGVSSRGIGDIEMDSDGRNIVNEDTYNFVCFDVVVQPAAARARQAYESVKESTRTGVQPLMSNLLESVSRAVEESDLSFVTNLAEKIDIPNKDELLEHVENKREEIKSSLTSAKANEILQKDLQEAYSRIAQLEEQVKKPIIRDKTLSELAVIKSQLTKLSKMCESDKKTISNQYKSALEENANLRSDSQVSKARIADLEKEISSLQESLNLETKENARLNEAIDYSRSFVKECKKVIGGLEKSNKKLKESYISLQRRSVDKDTQSSIAREAKDFKLAYLQLRESQYGIDLSTARRHLSEAKSPEDLERLINESVQHAISVENRRKPNISKAIVENTSFETNESYEGSNSVLGSALSKIYNGGI